ncbi:hypothetical protein GOBAR_AA01257 [Gossypium barbadense]|uniref:Uncharacterized protein n=1 Tax=Gossypium barbadense TaxID=3634 RepID=A0A2P5YUU0_GOSBA|nr:hypothetical protein GOBAR_AA01257 [Gossypium barbadense]
MPIRPHSPSNTRTHQTEIRLNIANVNPRKHITLLQHRDRITFVVCRLILPRLKSDHLVTLQVHVLDKPSPSIVLHHLILSDTYSISPACSFLYRQFLRLLPVLLTLEINTDQHPGHLPPSFATSNKTRNSSNYAIYSPSFQTMTAVHTYGKHALQPQQFLRHTPHFRPTFLPKPQDRTASYRRCSRR